MPDAETEREQADFIIYGESQMKKKHYEDQKPPFLCAFSCGSSLMNKYSDEADAWDWFTGYGDKTIHFCPACRGRRKSDIERIRVMLDSEPDGWPGNKIDTVYLLKDFK
jgi:hypothetical protein